MGISRAVLQNNELLRFLDGAGLDRLLHAATRHSYRGNKTIFAEGDPGDAVFGVIAGQVQISARTPTLEEVLLDVYESGRMFGMVAVIDGLPRCVSARAAPKAEVFVICRDQFLSLLAHDPLLSLGLLSVFCRHQRAATRIIVDEYAQKSLPARLAHRVLELAGSDGNGGRSIDDVVSITQAELARFVFASRQVVNHYLREWDREGWVAKSRRRLVVTNRRALLSVASNGHARKSHTLESHAREA